MENIYHACPQWLLLATAAPVAQALVHTQAYAYQLAMLVLGLGSVPVFVWLYRTGGLPRWLSGWGVAGYALQAIGAGAVLLGLPIGLWLSLPGGVLEAVLALWLVAGRRPQA